MRVNTSCPKGHQLAAFELGDPCLWCSVCRKMFCEDGHDMFELSVAEDARVEIPEDTDQFFVDPPAPIEGVDLFFVEPAMLEVVVERMYVCLPCDLSYQVPQAALAVA